MPGPDDLFAQIRKRPELPRSSVAPGDLIAQIQEKKNARRVKETTKTAAPQQPVNKPSATFATQTKVPPGKLFHFDSSKEVFLFDLSKDTPCRVEDRYKNADTDILIPLAPCIYRLTDYTFAKKEPVELRRCILKLGVLRCLERECKILNNLLWHRLKPPELASFAGSEEVEGKGEGNKGGSTIEEDELGKARFMELLSNCGVFQKVSDLLVQRAGRVADAVLNNKADGNIKNPFRIPQLRVDGLDMFLQELETLAPSLQQARDEIKESQTVSFYPGLGELFTPGSKLFCHPEGMDGSPVGCSCVQSWYAEEINKATNKVKRRFVLVIEFIVSVGDELVFVAASDVYPEFHDTSRNVPIKDLKHRKLLPERYPEDISFLERLQQRGEFYASVATKNHYLEYHSDSFFPIISGGWSNNAVRPLAKGGRVMVDVKRGILEGHIPVRGASDGMSDTVKEAIKLFEQSKRTGLAVPFRTCILPEFDGIACPPKKNHFEKELSGSDRPFLWQSWPLLSGFSFTARVWGKLLLSLPKESSYLPPPPASVKDSPRRASIVRKGVQIGGLGGVGECGNCGYIHFQAQAFEQLVLSEDKKELIRAVARNAGSQFDECDDDEDEDVMGLDVIANKGSASIFLLHGPPGCGKTLTAEAIAELLQKPLYVVTAGDLGITASEVEKTLGSVLELCQTWDALVLIDEADVFLEARNSTEIQRNALVCVMLRLLEYYSGCLFLSSNRSAGSIDAAIASRITVMLSYPPLDVKGRAKVWQNLIGLVPSQPINPVTGKVSSLILQNPRKASKYRVNFSDSDYTDLGSKYLLNGRQIKNSIVLARALARERGVPLSLLVLHRAVTAVAGEEAILPSNAN